MVSIRRRTAAAGFVLAWIATQSLGVWAAPPEPTISPSPVAAAPGPGPVFEKPQILNSHAPEGQVTNVFGGPGIDGNGQIATDGAGHWVAVWHSSDTLDERIGSDWDILVVTSVDNGATWTERTALNRNAGIDTGEDLSPVIATDEAGTWIVAWTSTETFGGVFGRDRDLFFARSTNNGRTWSHPVPLNVNASEDWGDDSDVRITTDGSGKWLAVWASNDSLSNRVGGDTDIFVSRSNDNGATWSHPMPLNTTAAVDKGFDASPDIVTDGAGLWIAAWSSGDSGDGKLGTDRDILISRSEDAGATWTDPAPLNSTAADDENSDWTPRLATDGRGNWVAVWSSADSLGDTIGVDRDILVSRSVDNGRTWGQAKALNLNAGVDSREDSSPTIVTDSLGNWLVAWHAWGGLSYDDGSDADVVVAYSRDNGASWSVPMHANPQARQDTVDDILPSLATDGAGHWVAMWQSFMPDESMTGETEWRVYAVQAHIADKPDELATAHE